jgi:hypothetical protein
VSRSSCIEVERQRVDMVEVCAIRKGKCSSELVERWYRGASAKETEEDAREETNDWRPRPAAFSDHWACTSPLSLRDQRIVQPP